MNHMTKKFAASALALACAASITLSGTAFVWAVDVDEDTINSINTYAEGITETIIDLSDEEIEAYLEADDDFTVSAMTAWQDTKEDVGELVEIGDAETEYDDDGYTVTVPVTFEKEDAEFIYILDETITPTSLSVDIQYSLGTVMKNAALNTVMGLGTVFIVLALLIFLISMFKYIPGSGAAKKKEEPAAAPKAEAPVQAAPVQAVPAADDKELIAVITAAIAEAEGTTPDGFVVRSIRKLTRSKR